MRVLYLSFIVVLADQVTKLLVKGFSIPFLNFNYDGMYIGQVIPVIGDFFRLTFIENPGMAFGYDPGSSIKLWVTLFSLAASVGLIIYIYLIRNKSLSLRVAIAMILGGAVGNLIDRMFYGVFFDYAPLFYGKVVDFLDFDFFNFTLFGKSYDRWPIFNIADSAVTIGVLILILFYKKHQIEDEAIRKTEIEDGTGNQVDENVGLQNAADNYSEQEPANKKNRTDDESDNRKDLQD